MSLKRFGFGAGADDDDLHRVEQEPLQGQPVAAGVEAEVLDDAGKGGQRLLGNFAIFLASAESFKAQQGRGGGGIAGRGGRILERLAAGGQSAQRRRVPGEPLRRRSLRPSRS